MQTLDKIKYIQKVRSLFEISNTLLGEICDQDGERGSFYQRTIVDYITDAVDGPHGFDSYLKSLRLDSDDEALHSMKVAMKWEDVPGGAPPLYYKQIAVGELIQPDDLIYRNRTWISMYDAFGESFEHLKEVGYNGKFLLVRKEEASDPAPGGEGQAPQCDLQPAGV